METWIHGHMIHGDMDTWTYGNRDNGPMRHGQ
jgi:hypothetical protein